MDVYHRIISFVSPAERKEQAADLERVRNNQRRCRARQKEYIASLENKVRQYESVSAESVANEKLEKLSTENKSLKQLLHSLGLRDGFLEAYCSAMQVASNLSPISALRNQSCPQVELCASPSLSLGILQVCESEGLWNASKFLTRSA